jgi:hypothetical protein
MENAPVIHLSSRSPTPGADADLYNRYLKWADEVYFEVNRTPQLTGRNYYKLARESPEYGLIAGISHFRNLQDWIIHMESDVRISISKEFAYWRERGVNETIWSAAYALIKSYRNKPVFSSDNLDTRIEDAPIMHLEAYRMSSEEQDKYIKWFADFGCSIFMPLFAKLPGFAGYDWYQDTGKRQGDYMLPEYPQFLYIIYFENMQAFESFTKSPELAGFQKTIRMVLPRRLDYMWYVQYQL